MWSRILRGEIIQDDPGGLMESQGLCKSEAGGPIMVAAERFDGRERFEKATLLVSNVEEGGHE